MLPKYEALLQEAKETNSDMDSVKLCCELLSLSARLTDKCVKNLNEFGLLEGRFVAMLLIKNSTEITPHELADKIGLTRASITSVIDFLENKNYVIRIPSAKDRRSLNLRLKPEGEKVLAAALKTQISWLSSIMTSLTEVEKQQFSNILSKVQL